MVLINCGSAELAWLLLSLAGGTFFWYLLISMQWYYSFSAILKQGKVLWRDMVLFFVAGSLAWCVPVILSTLSSTNSFRYTMIYFVVLNLVCPIYWWVLHRRLKRFNVYGSLGEAFAGKLISLYQMSDRDIAEAARALSEEFLSRKAKSMGGTP